MKIFNVPVEMQCLKQWVMWRYEDRGELKYTKVPYNASDLTLASSTNPATWSTFDACCSRLSQCDGMGFVLTQNDPFCIIDLDKTEDPVQINKQVEICNTLDSYSELSPSGQGLHIVINASLEKGRRSGPFEFYSSGRFMTMTGNVYLDRPIKSAQADLNKIMLSLGVAPADDKSLVFFKPEVYTDLQIWEIAVGAENGQKFLDLWNGDIHSHHFGDHSAADLALINMLVFYTQNKDQIVRMFRQSGLGRRAKANREDYVNAMIVKAFDNNVPTIDFSQLNLLRSPRVVRPTTIIEKPPREYSEQGALSIPPGLTGDIANFIFQQSYKPVPEMAIVGALGMMAGLAGRAFNVSNTGLNLYMLLLAGTGRGKEEMAKGVSKITSSLMTFCPSIHDFEGPGDLASGQALLRYLTDHKTGSFLSIFGEFGIKLKSICRKNALSSELMLQKVLLDLYTKSGRTDKVMPTAYSDSDRNTRTIHSPAVSIIGESTPHWFYENIDEDMITSGLLPRFAVVEYLGKRPPSNPAGAHVKPDADMLNRIATLVSVSQGLLQATQRYDVSMDGDAERLSHELDVRADDEINSCKTGVSAELWNRVHLKALRIAALLAVGKNPYTPSIDAECFMWAENFVIHGVECLKRRFDSGEISKNDEIKQIDACLALLSRYLLSKPSNASITEEMHRRRVVPASYLMVRLRSLKIFATDKYGAINSVRRVISALEDSGELIRLNGAQSLSLFGSTAKLYAISSTVGGEGSLLD